MTATHQRLSLLLAIAGMLLVAVGFIGFARFMPPPSPNMSAADIVGLYQQDTHLKRLGFVLMMLGNGLYFGLVAVISVQMKRMAGASPVLHYTQLVSGSANALLLMLPSVFFTAAAFRPERSADVTVALHDVGWFFTVMPVSSFMLQQFAIALAIFADKGPRPVFPRWLAYLNVWAALLYLPAYMDTFFKTGPFAWDGLLAFWIPVFAFAGLWLPITYVMLFKAISRQQKDAVAMKAAA